MQDTRSYVISTLNYDENEDEKIQLKDFDYLETLVNSNDKQQLSELKNGKAQGIEQIKSN